MARSLSGLSTPPFDQELYITLDPSPRRYINMFRSLRDTYNRLEILGSLVPPSAIPHVTFSYEHIEHLETTDARTQMHMISLLLEGDAHRLASEHRSGHSIHGNWIVWRVGRHYANLLEWGRAHPSDTPLVPSGCASTGYWSCAARTLVRPHPPIPFLVVAGDHAP